MLHRLGSGTGGNHVSKYHKLFAKRYMLTCIFQATSPDIHPVYTLISCSTVLKVGMGVSQDDRQPGDYVEALVDSGQGFARRY